MNQQCSSCATSLAPGALVCGNCHALVHATELAQLSASARRHEEAGELVAARSDWAGALALLPPEISQADWILATIKRLDGLTGSTPTADARRSWARKFGPFAPLVIVLANAKYLLALLKFKFLLNLGSFVAVYWALYGMKFGIGFAILILVHEMGHFIDIKRRGLPADMPVFLPGLGAYVRWSALGVSAQTRAFVSLAGPLAGCLGAALCAVLWMETGDRFWVGLATLSALLNVLNLIPVWVLDGGQAIGALNKNERIILCVAAILLAVYFHQPLLLLVAGGAGYRLFSKDIPLEPSPSVTAYYLIVLAALGYLMQLAPITFPGQS